MKIILTEQILSQSDRERREELADKLRVLMTEYQDVPVLLFNRINISIPQAEYDDLFKRIFNDPELLNENIHITNCEIDIEKANSVTNNKDAEP